MLGRSYESQVCSIARTLEVFGERWTFLILRNAAFAGSVRFVDFERSLGIPTNVLATRLAHLVESGVMAKLPRDGRDRTEYRLTGRGHDLIPALMALTEWGDRWLAPDGKPVLYRHKSGEHPVSIHVVCDTCGLLEDLGDIEALPGPGMPEPLAQRVLQRHHEKHAT
jgi:DNA-binding HxlR family transcriptional regulator